VIVYLTVTTSAVNEFFYIGTTGVLMVSVVYAVASFGAFRFLFFSGMNRAPRWEMAVPLLTIFNNEVTSRDLRYDVRNPKENRVVYPGKAETP
jgi:hypothetical protein